MLCLVRTFRRFTATVCASNSSYTDVNIPETDDGSVSSPCSRETIDIMVVDTEVVTTSPTEPKNIKSHRFREFRPCKKLVYRVRELKRKLNEVIAKIMNEKVSTRGPISEPSYNSTPIDFFCDSSTNSSFEFSLEDLEALSPIN
ncbi:CIC11C00000004984 [Sungouiella intermedia]|uniref:CIC11C00000004984 n=1 Tax=Sungouiella intermedia TaxID=45354 RepID=A0A1L0GP71_9ASCO|nr:CIC11C00000004984 [[Candida] intermedia]